MNEIFVLNEPTSSCCGRTTATCNCGGNDDGYVYRGRYSSHWSAEDEAERQREEQRIQNERPTPMPEVAWNFQEDRCVVKEANQPSHTTRQVNNSGAPTPMVDVPWVFTNEFGSNRR